jgi:hypothetical protein
MAAVTELVERLGVVAELDAAVGLIKTRDRGCTAGQLLADRQWAAVETGVAASTARMLRLLPARRAAALAEQVTVDLDTTDVAVYGGKKRGVAYNHQGQRVGRPHVATWAQTGTVLAGDLLAGDIDPRPGAPGLLRRALGALPPAARAGRVRTRADAGYFAGELARAAHSEQIGFAIGAKRIAPLWRMLDTVAEGGWVDAVDMPAAQVAVADYRPDWWPADTRLLIRRVRLDVAAAPCTPTSAPYPWPSSPTPRASTATRSS